MLITHMFKLIPLHGRIDYLYDQQLNWNFDQHTDLVIDLGDLHVGNEMKHACRNCPSRIPATKHSPAQTVR